MARRQPSTPKQPKAPRPVPAHRAGREHEVRPEPALPDAPGAARIVQASIAGTVLFALTAVPAAIAPDTFVGVAVLVSLALFAVGLVAFVWAYAVAVGRSRTDLMGIGGLFFLAGSAPRVVQRRLIGSLVAEIVIAVVTASTRVYTPLAFGVLVPMYGLGLMGLWGARYGTFPPRPPQPA
jgi:hypothetical protein